jgi:hemoglobin/transferrin/lactoferrin receptor protein
MVRILLLLAMGLQPLTCIIAQSVLLTDTIEAKNELQEVVVSGSKFAEKSSRLAVSIKTIRQSDFRRLNMSTTANLLETSGLAFVQKSQQGGGSPVIRGFEASRVLLMVDGVRMNNAIYRSGHLQNIITVDPNILNNIEVVYGPSSTLYGSDALGGVVNMFSKDPALAGFNKKDTSNVNAMLRYSSAIDEKMTHVDINFGGQQWGSLTSVTYSNFGNTTIGKSAKKNFSDFGLKHFYVDRINGRDTSLPNTNPYQLKPTNYNQWDVMQKVVYKSSSKISHLLNIQLSHSTDIPRYDRLSEVASNLPRFAEWYYGPQKRYLASYKFEQKDGNTFFPELKAVLSYQLVEESRYDRRFRQSIRNERVEKINVGGLTVDARKKTGRHELVIGSETQLNNLTSVANGFNIDNGSVSKVTTRYPDGRNTMNYVAAYAQHIYKIKEHFTLNDGVRLNYVSLLSNFVDTGLLHFPFTSAKQTHVALNGNLGLVYSPHDRLKVAGVFSTGFRAPNFDDLAKVFDTRPGAVIVPNPYLKPEYTYNGELNLVKYFEVNRDAYGSSIGGSLFYTWFRNAIVVDRFTFNNSDSIIYGNVKSGVLASQNKAKANLWGWNVYGNLKFNRYLQMNGTVSYTYGRYFNNNAEVPLDHIPPVYGRLSLRYSDEKCTVELYSLFNGWKRIEDYNPNGEDNQQYATAEGMPGWNTINATASYNVTKKAVIQLNVENIFDVRYRTFSSGVSAPGRNFVLAMKTSF